MGVSAEYLLRTYVRECRGVEMAVHPKPNDNRSFLNVVSDIAFGARNPKAANEDGKTNLDDVLTELEVSERESEDLYMPSLAVNEDKPVPRKASGPAPAAAPSATADSDDALRRAGGHRERMEKLLNEARQIEEMIAKEAAEAAALADKVNLEGKRAAMAAAAEHERQAITRANELAKRRDEAVSQHDALAAQVRESKEAVDAALKSVVELQSRLAEAQKVVTQTKTKLREGEGHLEQAHTLVDQAKVEAHNADRRAAKCSEALAAAETDLHEAEEIAKSIAATTETLERIRALSSGSK